MAADDVPSSCAITPWTSFELSAASISPELR